jgi:hypothetical protein
MWESKRKAQTPGCAGSAKRKIREGGNGGQMNYRKALGTAFFTAVLACSAAPWAHASTLKTDVIGMFPQNIGEFAYADLKAARALPWFPQLEQQMLPSRFKEFEKALNAAGIDPNSQVEEVAWATVPPAPASAANQAPPANGATAQQKAPSPGSDQIVGIALGSFRPETAEIYFKNQKIPVVKVRNFSLYAFGGGSGPTDLFFFFLDSNTAAFGQRQQLERLLGIRAGEEQSLLSDSQMFPLINEANGSGMIWAVMNSEYAHLAMQQLAPEAAQFPQAQQLVSRMRAMSLTITAGSGVQATFQSICATPDDANTFAALLQAGLLYKRYQLGSSNPDLASLLDSTTISPAGDRLNVRLSLTDAQMLSLIRRNTFAVTM